MMCRGVNRWISILFSCFVCIAQVIGFSCHVLRGQTATETQNAEPSATFSVLPSSGTTETEFTFQLITHVLELQSLVSKHVRWDWESDGTWDTGYLATSMASHQFAHTGLFNVSMEVIDSDSTIETASRWINVVENGAPGQLQLQESSHDSLSAMYQLSSLNVPVLSPDGRHLYILHEGRNSIVVCAYENEILRRVGTMTDIINGGWYTDLAAVVSPDGSHFYAFNHSLNDITLVAFARNTETGMLSFIEQHKSGQNGVSISPTAEYITISPDGRHIYLVDPGEQSFTIFTRNSKTGALIYTGHFPMYPIGIWNSFIWERKPVFSPDGAYVYITRNRNILVYKRNYQTGVLTLTSEFRGVEPGIDIVDGIQSMAISPDNRHLYAVGGREIGIFNREIGTGALTLHSIIMDGKDGVDGLYNAYVVTISPDGNYVYSGGQQEMAVFRRDKNTGNLSYVERVHKNDLKANAFHGILDMVVSVDGQHLYAACVPGAYLYSFARSTSGNLNTAPVPQIEVLKCACRPRNEFIFSVARSYDREDDASHLEVRWDWQSDGTWDTEYSTEKVANFRCLYPGSYTITLQIRDSGGLWNEMQVPLTVEPWGGYGHLTWSEVYQQAGEQYGLAGATWVTVSPDNRHVYVAGRNGSSVVVFVRDSVSGLLSYLTRYRENENGVEGIHAVQCIAVSPDGKHLYTASGSGMEDHAVAVFKRDSDSGRLTYIETWRDGSGEVDGLQGAWRIILNPDGSFVYVLSGYGSATKPDNAIAIFQRNENTGRISYRGMIQDGVNDVEGLDGVSGAVMSPDGLYCYVTASGDNSLTVLQRNPDTGMLILLESQRYESTSAKLECLRHAAMPAISPDGAFLYVVSDSIQTVSVFSRNTETGGLSYVEERCYSVMGGTGPEQSNCVLVTPDGGHVIVTAGSRNVMIVLNRDRETGKLTNRDYFMDGDMGVESLEGIHGLAMSTDSKFLYVAAAIDDAVTVFIRDYISSITDMNTMPSISQVFTLSQNYPNPFNPTTTIRYALPRDTRVRLAVYDLLGRWVVTLVDVNQSVGEYSVPWDGRNGNGARVASGIYIYRLEAGPFVECRKMLLLK